MLVYKATNKHTNKSYVGLTETTLELRIQRHWGDRNKSENNKFKNALKKYGKDAFVWEVLHECETVAELDFYEQVYIEKFDTYNNGYNSTTGGYLGHMTDKKLSELHGIRLPEVVVGAGQRRSEHYRENMSKSKKEWWDSEEGMQLRQEKSERMKEFWSSPEGQKQKRELAKKCGRPQQTKLDNAQQKEAFDKWQAGQSVNSLSKEYGVARPTLMRYFKNQKP